MVTETFTAGEDFTVPDGVFSLTLELEGANGEGSSNGGGRVVGEVQTTPGETFRIGFTAGGTGPGNGGNGGEAADIRRNGTTLSDRIVVAAGAGGQGGSVEAGAGGAGGADQGEDGSGANTGIGFFSGGTGGTQTSGGSLNGAFGIGGDGEGFEPGGGGAGWYGGGGAEGGVGDDGASGGGGSNYDDGLDSVTANERGTSTRSFGQGGLVTITYEQTPGAENLAITDTTATSNTLDWDAPTLPPEVDSVDQYRVFRATDPGTVRADYTEVGTTPTPGFEDTGLDNGIEYHYRIGADLFIPEAEGTITITDFRGV
jgi:hypothetical protein